MTNEYAVKEMLNGINMGMISVLSNANMIKKVYFPRIILPISSVTSCLVNFLISCIIILLFCICIGLCFSIYFLWLPLMVFILFLFFLGFFFFLLLF